MQNLIPSFSLTITIGELQGLLLAWITLAYNILVTVFDQEPLEVGFE